METRLTKAELLSGSKSTRRAELGCHVAPKPKHRARVTIEQQPSQAKSLDAIAVARAEMARRKRRLGKLTREQEVAIEDLLLSTAIRISELLGRALERHPFIG